MWAAVMVAPYLIARWPQLNVFAERYLYLPSVGIYLTGAALFGTARSSVHGPMQAPGAASARGAYALIVLATTFLFVAVLRTRDWRDEETIYEKTLGQSERAELIRNNLALRYLHTDRAAEGLPIQQSLLELKPDFPSGWHNLGLLHLAVGEQRKALRAFEEANRREPSNPATLLNLGYTYDVTGNREAAVQSYFRLIGVEPQSTKGWYNLAVIAVELGQMANARRALTAVLATAPEDRPARALLTEIESSNRPSRPNKDVAALERRTERGVVRRKRGIAPPLSCQRLRHDRTTCSRSGTPTRGLRASARQRALSKEPGIARGYGRAERTEAEQIEIVRRSSLSRARRRDGSGLTARSRRDLRGTR
jgi:tetratricopeptide (TPR) repeat protein